MQQTSEFYRHVNSLEKLARTIEEVGKRAEVLHSTWLWDGRKRDGASRMDGIMD
jgi:hypothetical protein